MNRAKKEELRKYRAAREGLSPEEIAELDRREKAQRDLDEQVRDLHAQLFPEEHDWYYDSTSESMDRRRGINPMSAHYIEKTNRRRAQLGFSEYVVGKGPMSNTLDWVRERLAAGRNDDLQKILSARDAEDRAEEDARREAALKTDIDAEVDKMLSTKRFYGADTDTPDDLAFRVYGCCMSIEACKVLGTDAMFHTQIRRLLPGLSDKAYNALHDAALERWTDVYFPD
jgi:hypothetical protein